MPDKAIPRGSQSAAVRGRTRMLLACSASRSNALLRCSSTLCERKGKAPTSSTRRAEVVMNADAHGQFAVSSEKRATKDR